MFRQMDSLIPIAKPQSTNAPQEQMLPNSLTIRQHNSKTPKIKNYKTPNSKNFKHKNYKV
jgi:hypothetical protein